MAKTSAIEWCDATWNPFYGCAKVSEGCQNCYAERNMKRFGKDFNKITRASDATFYAPLKWKEPRKIFVCSWGDFFHDEVIKMYDDPKIFNAILAMLALRQHTYFILTKRPQNFFKCEIGKYLVLFPNVWLGVTAENQKRADERIPILLKIPAVKRFVSVEPQLGPVDLGKWIDIKINQHRTGMVDWEGKSDISWVICGAESGSAKPFHSGQDKLTASGSKRRPFNKDWARSLRDQCAAAGVPFFYKQGIQNGKLVKMPMLDGKIHDGRP